jgi:hypothetical protein
MLSFSSKRSRAMKRKRACAAICVVLTAISCGHGAPTVTSEEDGTVTLVAVGDIACGSPPASDGDRCRYGDVAELVHAQDPDLFLALGDIQYASSEGTIDFGYFDDAFGDLLPMTVPTAGDEDWGVDRRGYLDYFGARTTRAGYDSASIGGWHIIVLNSQDCVDDDGCAAGSEQYEWLRRELEDPPASAPLCTMAIWHDPRFLWTQWWTKDGVPRGPQDAVAPLWELLYEARAEVVLNANAHHYERWEPMNERGQVSSDGITQFVVGTGGKGLNAVGPDPRPRQLATDYDGGFGVLVMGLGTAWLDYRWEGTDPSASFADTGTIFCA